MKATGHTARNARAWSDNPDWNFLATAGRGSPMIRGVVTGIMTAVGGLGHALPYLIPDFWLATYVAIAVVVLELLAITFIQHKYMQTPWLKAMLQIILGGALVLGAGVLIGSG